MKIISYTDINNNPIYIDEQTEPFPYFEKSKKWLDFEDINTCSLVKEDSSYLTNIELYENKLKEAKDYSTEFPIGYACELGKSTIYRIRFSELFQLVMEQPPSTALLDFVASDSNNIEKELKGIMQNVNTLFQKIATQNDVQKEGVITVDIEKIVVNVVDDAIKPLYENNFFHFLIACAFLQYYIELTIYSFYPFAALKIYETILGTTFNRECAEYRSLTLANNNKTYDITPFLDYAIAQTSKFICEEKEKLSYDLGKLVGTKEVMVDNTILQKLFLLESQNQLKSSYINTNFNVHLMPIGTHKSDHTDIVNRIVVDNVDVREVYDINSVTDWFRYEFISLFKGNISYKKCSCCGRFFIPSGRSDSEYCDRINPEYNRLCKEIGATLTFTKRHENDAIHQAYTRAYRRMDSRKRSMYLSKKEFTEWSKTAREKRKLCEDGEISFDEFQAWLDESKRK